MSLPLKSSHDRADVHRHTIEDLADEMQCDSELVADVYWAELDALERAATVHEYVTVFAVRRTRARLKDAHRRD